MSAPRLAVPRPCRECPWRMDVDPGKFPACRYDALRSTAPAKDGTSAGLDAPLFACHRTPDGGELACAGFLAVVGRNHVRVRLLVSLGQLDPAQLDPGPDWPPLFPDYATMAARQGGTQ